ncbi:MAG: alpha/beta fold hydrolase [Xanthomonadales bacterium]|nr:alpha/beta fold hydrolase [Xanthomonadales bacterium]NIX13791.1 alpha/beta fold hydrolase [Xanthomonadales bacterium]
MTEASGIYRPPPGLSNPHLQSLLNSSALRGRLVRRRARELVAAEQEWLMDGGHGVRLIAHYSKQAGDSRGLAVLLHGWEGSSRSNYILATGARLFAGGYDVFRLNLRDHGDSHHLNAGIFHSCRLNEVINALADMQDRTGAKDWAMAGFSLGGNFTLRVALYGPERRDLDMARAVAVCPVLNPLNALGSMEQGPGFYEKYYNRKWADSLRKKQRHYPDRYDYEAWFAIPSMREKTRFFATRYYDYDTLENYFDGYSVAGDRLAPLRVPSTILSAADDPVIPVSDTETLPDNPYLEIVVTQYGGHCGYLKNWRLQSWAEDFIFDRFTNGHEVSVAMSEQTA